MRFLAAVEIQIKRKVFVVAARYRALRPIRTEKFFKSADAIDTPALGVMRLNSSRFILEKHTPVHLRWANSLPAT